MTLTSTRLALVLFTILSYLYAIKAHALPQDGTTIPAADTGLNSTATQNSTQIDRVGWMPEPRTRGTLSILWSCLFTLFVCSWTAVHPNVLDGFSSFRRFKHRLGLTLLALFFPEMTALLALLQLSQAQELSRQRPNWCLSTSLYVVSGGIKLRSSDGKDLIPDYNGLLALEQAYNLQINLNENDIRDKGKRDGLGKLVSCTQIIWVTVQVIGRFVQGLPVAPLELFTLSNVLGAIAIYGIWWYKPQDVETATIISIDSDYDNIMQKVGNIKCFEYIALENVGFFIKPEPIYELQGWVNAGIMVYLFVFAIFSVLLPLSALRYVEIFSTATKKYMWISVSATCGLCLVVMIGFVPGPDSSQQRSLSIGEFTMLFANILFFVCRLFLISLAFASLRSLPISAYTALSWESFIPHF